MTPTARHMICSLGVAALAGAVVLWGADALAGGCYDGYEELCMRRWRAQMCLRGDRSYCDPSPIELITSAWRATLLAALPAAGAALLLGAPLPRHIWQLPALHRATSATVLSLLGFVPVAFVLAVLLSGVDAPDTAEAWARALAFFPLLLCSAAHWWRPPRHPAPAPLWLFCGGLVGLLQLASAHAWMTPPSKYVTAASFWDNTHKGLALGLLTGALLHWSVARLISSRHDPARLARMDTSRRAL